MTVIGRLRPSAIWLNRRRFYDSNYKPVFEAILSLMRYTSKTILPYYNFAVYLVHSSFFAKTGSTVGRAHFLIIYALKNTNNPKAYISLATQD